MSQVSIIDIEGNHPEIPTRFDANVGFAIPIANVLEILGDTVAAGIVPVQTVGSGNTITTNVQISQAIAAPNAANVGLAAFDSADFTVDADGFVSLSGSGGAFISSVATDVGGPVVPDGGGQISILGSTGPAIGTPLYSDGSVANILTMIAQVASTQVVSSITNAGLASFNTAMFTVDANGFVTATGSVPIQFTANDATVATPAGGNINIFAARVAAGTSPASTTAAGSTLTVNVQTAQALAATDATKVGLSNFDSAAFDVDANGFVQLNGGGIAASSFDVQANTAPGTDPVVPTAAGLVTVNGAVVANHSVVLETRSRAANAYNLEIQYATTAAAGDGTKSGVAHFNSTQFTVDAVGFVSLSGGGLAIDSIGVQTGTNPIAPTAAGLVTINGAVVAAGTNPVRSDGTGANTMAIEVQISQAIAATDATKIGLCNFNSAQFSVDANGFVSTSGTGIPNTITGDSGGALSPTAGNWNILGLSGSKTSGSGSTLTVKSPPFSQVGASATSSLNTGEFVTAAVTRTLPASAGLADGDIFIYVCTTASALVIQAVSAQKIRIGNQITSAAGTITSTAIGDSVTLRFNATDGFFYGVAGWGNWTFA